MHIRLMSNFKSYFAFCSELLEKKAQNKFLLHSKAKQGTQGVQELFFCEIKASGVRSI